MSQLPRDVSRCVATTCGKRDTCARFMDCEPSPNGLYTLSFADLSPTAPPYFCPFFIEYKPKP